MLKKLSTTYLASCKEHPETNPHKQSNNQGLEILSKDISLSDFRNIDTSMKILGAKKFSYSATMWRFPLLTTVCECSWVNTNMVPKTSPFFTIFLTFIPTISESKSLQSTAIEGKNKLEREKATPFPMKTPWARNLQSTPVGPCHGGTTPSRRRRAHGGDGHELPYTSTLYAQSPIGRSGLSHPAFAYFLKKTRPRVRLKLNCLGRAFFMLKKITIRSHGRPHPRHLHGRHPRGRAEVHGKRRGAEGNRWPRGVARWPTRTGGAVLTPGFCRSVAGDGGKKVFGRPVVDRWYSPGNFQK